MRRGVDPAAWLAVLLLAFAAQGAWAHGGAEHPRAAGAAERGALGFEGAVAPPCGPGAPLHACGCGNLSLCEPSSKLAFLQAPPSRLICDRGFRDPAVRRAAWRPSHAFARAAHRPRAPPSFSSPA